MISVSNTVEVNPPGEPVQLRREDVWRGLLLKADNALPFVPAMTRCEVIERTGDTLLRTIEFRGQEFAERVTFTPERQVRFERTHGSILGTISNDLEEDDDGKLLLTFSFDLILEGVEPGSAAEQEYEATMKGDYLKAAAATLAAVRRMVIEEHEAAQVAGRGGSEMSGWLRDYYDDVDNMRLQAFVDRHTDDVVVKFGNNPPAVGKAEVEKAIGYFWTMIGGLRHQFVNVFADGDTTILEAEIDYERKDGVHVMVPCTSILHRRDGLVDGLRVYLDLAPVFAPAA
jgi:ketosteroid isomerase-like protein